MDVIIGVVLGLVSGVCVGYVLGYESPRRCADCLSNSENRYRTGHVDGWEAGARTMEETVKRRAIRAKNTWTITCQALDEALTDVIEIGKL